MTFNGFLNEHIENKLIKDEAKYMEFVGEVRNFRVNLTKMSNEELFTLKENAELEIRNHLSKYNIMVKSSIREDPRETVRYLPAF